jgi:ParB-like chromosome segregation protein Spo0J
MIKNIGKSFPKVGLKKSDDSEQQDTGKFNELMPHPDFAVSYIRIDKIKLPKSGRGLDKAVVVALMDSIGCIGLQHPISVIRRRGMVPRYRLVAGAHRVSACRRLGHSEILAHVISREDARLYRPAENLQRSEFRLLEKYAAIVEYERARKEIKRTSSSQPHDSGLSATARELKLSRRIVRQARAAQAITDLARHKLVALRLDNNAGLVAKVAEKQTTADQLLVIESRGRARGKSKMAPATKKVGVIPRSAAELVRRWNNSEFKKVYELSDQLVRDEFIRTTFR